VGVRVARARDILRDRLTRRGLALPATLAGAALAPSTVSAAAVPTALAASTVKAAIGVAAGKSLAIGGVSAAVSHLTQGVLKTMTLTKKIAVVTACILAVGLVSTGVVWVALQPTQEELAARSKNMNNLRRIALAINELTAIADVKERRYPEAAISKDGKPLLSWRVAILPFLNGCKPLYDRFHLDEPWDSPHNKTLLKEMPEVYAPVTGKAVPRFSTYYQVFVGPGALFERVEGRKPEPSLARLDRDQGTILTGTRGTSVFDVPDDFTILVVEAATPVPWTKPEDLTFDKDKPLPKLGGQFTDGFFVAYVNGIVRLFSKKIDPATIRALITRNGGEQVTPEQLDPE
jgi:hypothetical protein